MNFSNKTVDSKKVLLFTNQDNPIPDSLSKENKTIFNIINVKKQIYDNNNNNNI